jgi:hypothetical protein
VEKGLGYVSLGNLANTILGAVLWLYMTAQLNATQFGRLNYDISIASLLTAVGLMGLDTTLTAFLAKGISRMVNESTFLILLSSVVLSVIFFIVFSSLSLVLLILGMLFFGLVEAEQLGKSEFKKYMCLMLAQRILTLLLVPIFYAIFGIEGALYGFAFSYLLFLINSLDGQGMLKFLSLPSGQSVTILLIPMRLVYPRSLFHRLWLPSY